jgi:hypothetical protein
MSYERDTERNHCCICGKQLHSATFIGEWGCDCGDRELNSYRACAKCHSEHHSADNMTNYDPNMTLKANTKEIYEICVAKMLKAQQEDEDATH